MIRRALDIEIDAESHRNHVLYLIHLLDYVFDVKCTNKETHQQQ